MNLKDILNTIWDNASETYQERVPQATQTNILEIQSVMTDPNNAVVVNEFINTMLNMIVKKVVHSKSYENPLSSLKKGRKPLGDTIEEVYANFVKAKGFDPEGKELLTREMPDVKTAYHRMNRQDKYKITISPEQIGKAFLSYDNLESFISTLIATLTNSNELDEFIAMKQLIKIAMDNKAVKVVDIPDPLSSKENAESFIKTVKIVSGDMTFANSNNNAWLDCQEKDKKPIITFSKYNEQVLIIDNTTNVTVNVDVLASLFNMSVAEFNETRKVVIDAFPDPGIRAFLCDELFFQVYEDLLTFKRADNADGLFDNYWLHVWETLSYSPLVNAVCFKVAEDSDADGTVESFTITPTLKEGVTLSNKRTTVSEGSNYSSNILGDYSTVKVTMGGDDTDISSTAYNQDTKKIKIPKVTGDIKITVN